MPDPLLESQIPSQRNESAEANALGRDALGPDARGRDDLGREVVGRGAALERPPSFPDLSAQTSALLLADATPSKPQSYLRHGMQELAATFTSDKHTQETIAGYGANFVKTAALFTPGRFGLGATVLASAADEASPETSAREQVADALLGSAKGIALRKTLEIFGRAETGMFASPAMKGIGLGMTNRLSDAVLTRGNWTDGNLGTHLASAFDSKALGADAITFVAAHGLMSGLQNTGVLNVGSRFLYRNMAMSGTFGLSTGAYTEIQRQTAAGEKFDGMKVLQSAAIQGGVDAIAGMPGGLRGEVLQGRALRAKFEKQVQNELQSTSATIEAPLSPEHQALQMKYRALTPEASRLGAPYVVTENVLERTSTAGPFNNFEDYMARAVLGVPNEVRKYSVAGHETQVVMRDSYGKELDQSKPEFASRVRPEDVPALLDSLPNSKYIKRLFLEDRQNPQDDWVSQTYYQGFISSMAMEGSELQIYRGEKSDWLRRDVQHEWSHAMRSEFWNEALTGRFSDAVYLEGGKWVPKPYASRNEGEHWAVLGERMMGESVPDFIEATEKAPIRSVIWMSGLQKAIANLSPSERSPYHDFFVSRMDHVLQQVKPKALAELDQYSQNNPDTVDRLRQYINGL